MQLKALHRLYLVLDPEHCLKHSVIDTLKYAVAGGVNLVQLRCKKLSEREFIELGKDVIKILQPHHIPLIINDNINVAKSINADGLHIGQNDIDYSKAREILGPKNIIGLTIENIEQAQRAEPWGLNYFGVGPVFATRTKTDAPPPLNLSGLKQICEQTKKPVYAIGGITLDNVEEVMQQGPQGIAVVSAICSAYNPELSVKELQMRVI